MNEFPWGGSRRFNAFPDFCKKKFGTRLQKLSIDAGFSCPNRDGTLSVNGCTFCNNDAFSPSYCVPQKSVTQQINEGIAFHKVRYRHAGKYLAYFQAYSNTHAPLEKLKTLYTEALAHPDISGISIGTRPDCADEAKLNYFQELSQQYHIFLEFGIESCYDETLVRVNRGHDFKTSVQAIKASAERGIHTGVHLIMGLPGESREQMLEEADIISTLPVNSLKLHQLQIIKDTAMAKEFETDPAQFNLFEKETYIEFVIDFLERLRPDICVERLTAEVPPRFLAGPGWGLMRGDELLRQIEKRLSERDSWQGKHYRS